MNQSINQHKRFVISNRFQISTNVLSSNRNRNLSWCHKFGYHSTVCRAHTVSGESCLCNNITPSQKCKALYDSIYRPEGPYRVLSRHNIPCWTNQRPCRRSSFVLFRSASSGKFCWNNKTVDENRRQRLHSTG